MQSRVRGPACYYRRAGLALLWTNDNKRSIELTARNVRHGSINELACLG